MNNKSFKLGSKVKKIISMCLAFIMTLSMIGITPRPQIAKAADEYDVMRAKWVRYMTGGTSYDLNDPDVSSKLSGADASIFWNSMDKSPNRTYLWSDAPDNSDSNYISAQYSRLLAMAKAYNQYGGSLYQNSALATDIVNALEWMNQNRYNTTVPTASSYYNWYSYQIGGALSLLNCTLLMYDHLTSEQITNYVNAVLRYTPSIGDYTGKFTGANRLHFAEEFIKAGIVTKRSDLIKQGRDALDYLYTEVTNGEGIYSDGSFIQHIANGYNGGYGSFYAYGLLTIVDSLLGTSFAVTNPNVSNVYKWIYTVYEPVMYEGGFMSMVRGRQIASSKSNTGATEINDFSFGMDAVKAVVLASQSAPNASDRVYFKRLLKKWVINNTYQPILQNMSMYEMLIAKQIVNDPSVIPASEYIAHKRYYNMDKVVHGRPNFTFALSMFSKRIYNYESINKENLHGWFTNYGATYIYNGDQGQYNGNYWCTIDPYRIPGTTVSRITRPDFDPNDTTGKKGYKQSTPSGRAWVGGADISGLYGVSGMQLQDIGYSLEAKKSYFMFDDEIVCLGAGINSTDTKTIETIIENRAISTAGNNTFTVNGTTKLPAMGDSELMTNVKWAHLAGSTPKSDLGYYFPEGSSVWARRETRTGTWYDIHKNGIIDSNRTAIQSRNFLTIWQNHGTNPVDSKYSYVLLPNKTVTQISAYASNPNIEIIENSPDAQAVKEKTLGITAINFWNDSTKTVANITSTRKASLMVKESGDEYELAVSDPTQATNSPIVLEIDRKAASVISKDPNVTVIQLSPTIKLSISVSNMKGATIRAKFKLNSLSCETNNDAYVRDGAYANTNYGTTTDLVIKKNLYDNNGYNRKSYVTFDFSSYTKASIPSALLKLYITDVNEDLSRTVKIYGVSDETSTETGITWNNAPAGNSYITSLNVANTDKGKWITVDVTNYVKNHLSDKKVTFLLVNEGTGSDKNNMSFASREYSGYAPKLELEYPR